MKQLIYNSQTKETEIIDVPDTELPVYNLVQELTIEEKVTQMAEQLVLTQKQLEASQEALDFLLMGGM